MQSKSSKLIDKVPGKIYHRNGDAISLEERDSHNYPEKRTFYQVPSTSKLQKVIKPKKEEM